MLALSLHMLSSTAIQQVDVENIGNSPKFWVLQDLYNALLDGGVSLKVSNAIVFIIAFLALVAIFWLLNTIVAHLSSVFIKKKNVEQTNSLYDILVEQKFFNRLLVLTAITVVLLSYRILFSGFSGNFVKFVIALSRSAMIFWILLLLYSLLNSWDKYFKLHPKMQQASIRGYIQLAKIILGIIAGIFVLSTLTDSDPSDLLVGFGATAAFITLVFRDTILGFVASIQLSFQDMMRPGDWIEVPSKNADGIIVDINIISVKVQNWDNSVTMIPIYSLVTDSFTNWRRMELGPGRLFVRSFSVDIKSVKLANDILLEALSKHPVTATHFAEILSLAKLSSPSETLTNLALFRAHIELYLHKHPEINENLWLFVRYMEAISGEGIGLEIYAFSRQKSISGYDLIHRSVMEYVISTAFLFEIILFQKPSGEDMSQIGVRSRQN